jgi:adenylosuccinate lyase
MPNFQRARSACSPRGDVATCAISGAVGTFANIDPSVEEHVAAKLGLSVEPVSTQVIPRDRHAMFFATLGVIASSVERLAVEIRHLQRTEVLEAEEYFSPGQKGSSAMPHKRNPVLTENLTGLARMVRSAYAFPRWKMSRSGMSGTSAIPRWSAISAPMRRSRSISRSPA